MKEKDKQLEERSFYKIRRSWEFLLQYINANGRGPRG